LGESLGAGDAFTNFEADTETLFDSALKKLVYLDCVEAREIYDTLYFTNGRRQLDVVLLGESLPLSFGLR
jgi:hypothetical protein